MSEDVVVEGSEVRCPHCGSTDLYLVENVIQSYAIERADGERILVKSTNVVANDHPHVECEGCGRRDLDLPPEYHADTT